MSRYVQCEHANWNDWLRGYTWFAHCWCTRKFMAKNAVANVTSDDVTKSNCMWADLVLIDTKANPLSWKLQCSSYRIPKLSPTTSRLRLEFQQIKASKRITIPSPESSGIHELFFAALSLQQMMSKPGGDPGPDISGEAQQIWSSILWRRSSSAIGLN